MIEGRHKILSFSLISKDNHDAVAPPGVVWKQAPVLEAWHL
jgi:hypothetical protein